MPQSPRRKHKKKPLSEIIEKILRYGKEVQEWTYLISLEKWREDVKTVRATAMNLQIMGEEINTLLIIWEDLLTRSDFCAPLPMAKWEGLKHLRHGISHSYDNINEAIFYQAARDFGDVLCWAEAIEKNLDRIGKEELQKVSPRNIFSPYN